MPCFKTSVLHSRPRALPAAIRTCTRARRLQRRDEAGWVVLTSQKTELEASGTSVQPCSSRRHVMMSSHEVTTAAASPRLST